MPPLDEDLRAVLALYPQAERPLAPAMALGNAGGASGANLWRYRSGSGERVARAWPADGPAPLELERIHRWIRSAGALGFVPVPLPALDGLSFRERAGRLWEVAPWMPGAADPDQPPSASHLRAGFSGLAAFHQRLAREYDEGPSVGLLERLGELDRLLLGGFDRLGDLLDRAARDHRKDLAKDWLSLARTAAPAIREELRRAATARVVRQPCLRDARPGHLLFVESRLTGLVDFGAMALETVAADLARLLSEWIGPDREARVIALSAYAAVRPLHDSELSLIPAFERSAALLGGGHWIQWHYVAGRAFHDPDAVRRGIERGIERLTALISQELTA